jgi:putative ABC transport system ATP-binding protein
MPLIQANNITKNYRVGDMDVPALRGVSFEIGEGAFAAFVGPSGSGKSTLLNLIGCLDHPSSGELTVNGTNIATLSRSAAATFRGEHLGFCRPRRSATPPSVTGSSFR